MEDGNPVVRTNRRLVLTHFGGINKLKIQFRNFKELKHDHVRIKVEACSINYQDILARQGQDPSVTIKPPCVLGMEVSGRIDECGQDVTNFSVGDRVIGLVWSGGWSQYVSCGVEWVFLMPNHMTFAEAASIPVSYLTAKYLLFEFGGLKDGKSVFCHHATGDVGIAVGQLCKTVNNVTVYGVCPSSQQAFAQQHGYHHLAQEDNYVERMQGLAPSGFDIVIDTYSGPANRKNYQLTSRMGKHIIYGGATPPPSEGYYWIFNARQWWNPFQKDLFALVSDCKLIGGFILAFLAQDNRGISWMQSAMAKILLHYNNGIVTPIIDCIYRLEEFAYATQQMNQKQRIGKILFSPNVSISQPRQYVERRDYEELALPQQFEPRDLEQYRQEELDAGLAMAPVHSDELDDENEPALSSVKLSEEESSQSPHEQDDPEQDDESSIV